MIPTMKKIKLTDNEVLNEEDVYNYITFGKSLDTEKLSNSIHQVKIPIAPIIGLVRFYIPTKGWFYRKMDDMNCPEKYNIWNTNNIDITWNPYIENYFFHYKNELYYITGVNRSYTEKKKYLFYNINKLCKIYIGLKKFIQSR